MKHLMRRTIQLLAVSLLLSFLPAGDADAVFESALRGEYDLSAARVCTLESPTTVQTSFPTGTTELRISGTSVYDGAGGVTFTGQVMIPSLGREGTGVPSTSGFEIKVTTGNFTSCTGTYVVNTDGTFTQTFSTCSITFTSTSNLGDVATLTNVKVRGKIGLDGTVLVLGNTVASASDIEVFDCPTCDGLTGANNGSTQRRLCATTGTATARR